MDRAELSAASPISLSIAPAATVQSERRSQPARPRRAVDCQVAAVLESVTHGFLALDADWRITYANPAALDLSGTADRALVGRVHWDVWPETRDTAVEAQYRRVIREQRSAHFEHHYPGRNVWHEIHAFPTADGGLTIVYRDVSAEHAAAEERDHFATSLAARERELAVILDTATDAVVRFDRALRVTFANPAVTRATGIAPAALLGRTPSQLGLPPALVERCTTTLSELLASDRASSAAPVTLTFELDVGASRRWFEAQAVLEPDGDGSPRAVLVVARDVTARIEAERAVANALATAEAANRAKAEFLATMSHELRTPLNAIRGYAELLALGVHGPVTDGQREALARIQRNEQHLLGLITDILDYARIEAGRITYESTSIALRPLLEDVLTWLLPQAAAKSLTLDSQLCSATVCGDGRRLRQIVVNLLTNAVKFTPAGGTITLCCYDAPAGDRVIVEVRDTGPGIPAESQADIFRPFVQLGRTRQHPVAGIGLGLAISGELAQGMGGDLQVESTPGRGSVFRLELPAAKACG